VIGIAASLILWSTGIFAEEPGEAETPISQEANLTDEQTIQPAPRMGSIMMEYGHRFYVTYYAARADNWGLAQYQLKEMLELQEDSELSRPKYAKDLKAFESDYLDQVKAAADKKSWRQFTHAYKKAIAGCNACHTKTGHPYIRYRVPERAPKLLQLEIR